MLTLLSMIFGLVGSVIPEFMKKWQDSADKKHELAILEMQLKAAEKGHTYKMDEISVEAYSDMVQSAHRDQSEQIAKSSKWIAGLSASVRPVVTYFFLATFVGFKLVQFHTLTDPSLPWQNSVDAITALGMLWGEEENVGFWGIIAYWFGDRALRKPK